MSGNGLQVFDPLSPVAVVKPMSSNMRAEQMARYPVLSRFEKAKRGLSILCGNHSIERNEPGYYYSHVPAEMAVEALGWWNPMLNGRPKVYAQKLLEVIPAPASFKAYEWKRCGLMYFLPAVIKTTRSKARITISGLALLKHWSNEFPRFKPFFDVYYDPSCEKQIALDCVDFSLGLLPESFKQMMEKNAVKEAVILAEQARQAKLHAEAQQAAMRAEQMARQKQMDVNKYYAKSAMQDNSFLSEMKQATATQMQEMMKAQAQMQTSEEYARRVLIEKSNLFGGLLGSGKTIV